MCYVFAVYFTFYVCLCFLLQGVYVLEQFWTGRLTVCLFFFCIIIIVIIIISM